MKEATLNKLEHGIYILHPILLSVKAEIERFVQYGRKDEIQLVIGPSGVGKTKLAEHTLSDITRRLESGWRTGKSYPISVEAPSQTKKEFPWRAFLESLLLGLGELDLSKKIDLDKYEQNRRTGLKPPPRSKLTIAQLEQLVRKRIKALQPVAVIIDESQNIVEGLNIDDRRANLNRLKNWANTMETKFIMFGTHECRDLLNINEQLSRRITPVYFPRYSKTWDEVKEFASFYKSIIQELNLKLSPKINKDFMYIYNHTLGCPGLLVTWLHNSISHCIEAGLDTISYETFHKKRFSKDRLLTMELAIKEFEAEYSASLSEFDPDKVQAGVEPYQQSLELSFSKKPPEAAPKNKHRPGQKKPKRYPVCGD